MNGFWIGVGLVVLGMQLENGLLRLARVLDEHFKRWAARGPTGGR